MPAAVMNLGNHMYADTGARVSAFPHGTTSTSAYVINVGTYAALSGRVLRGGEIRGEIRKAPTGASYSGAWNGAVVVFGTPSPDGSGRERVTFSVSLPLRSFPIKKFGHNLHLKEGVYLQIVAPPPSSPTPFPPTIPSGAYVTVAQGDVYHSPLPGWSFDVPSEIAVGEEAIVIARCAYLDGEPVEAAPVTVESATSAVAIVDGFTHANSVTTPTDAEGRAVFTLRGQQAAGDAISVFGTPQSLFSPEFSGVYPINGSGADGDCVVVPAADAVASVPGYIVTTPQFGWDAGARSVTKLEGDVEVTFSMGAVVGAVVGLCATEDPVTTGVRDAISHGFYAYTDGGRQFLAQIMEHGARKGAVIDYGETDVFRIWRVGDVVMYTIEDDTGYVYFRRTSTEPLEGEVEVVSALYATGDKID